GPRALGSVGKKSRSRYAAVLRHLISVGRCAQRASAPYGCKGAALIRIDAIWLSPEALDMRAGTDTVLAGVVKVFGAARSHHAYLFANKNSTRMKVLVYDGFGI